MDKISVIIPCYNAEKYIERCIESIRNQTYTNLEIIVVNDGSTDKSKELVSLYMHDKRIMYIEQPNGGEFCARNTGLKAATGDYIGFVDSDDYIEPEMYEKLYKAVTENQADMAVCNFNLVYDNNEQEPKPSHAKMPNGLFEIQKDVCGYWINVCASLIPNNYVWTRLYKRSVVMSSGIFFEDYPHSSDTLFNFKLLPLLEKCAFVNEGLYHYVQRAGSGIHTIALRRNIAELYADTYQALADYYKENNYEAYFQVLPIHAYTRMRNVFFYSRLAGKEDDEIIETLISGWKDRDIFRYLVGKKK